MYVGKLVFSQVMEHLPLHTFRRCVARYNGEHKVKHFSCLESDSPGHQYLTEKGVDDALVEVAFME
jgi:hypothetical protein